MRPDLIRLRRLDVGVMLVEPSKRPMRINVKSLAVSVTAEN